MDIETMNKTSLTFAGHWHIQLVQVTFQSCNPPIWSHVNSRINFHSITPFLGNESGQQSQEMINVVQNYLQLCYRSDTPGTHKDNWTGFFFFLGNNFHIRQQKSNYWMALKISIVVFMSTFFVFGPLALFRSTVLQHFKHKYDVL